MWRGLWCRHSILSRNLAVSQRSWDCVTQRVITMVYMLARSSTLYCNFPRMSNQYHRPRTFPRSAFSRAMERFLAVGYPRFERLALCCCADVRNAVVRRFLRRTTQAFFCRFCDDVFTTADLDVVASVSFDDYQAYIVRQD